MNQHETLQTTKNVSVSKTGSNLIATTPHNDSADRRKYCDKHLFASKPSQLGRRLTKWILSPEVLFIPADLLPTSTTQSNIQLGKLSARWYTAIGRYKSDLATIMTGKFTKANSSGGNVTSSTRFDNAHKSYYRDLNLCKIHLVTARSDYRYIPAGKPSTLSINQITSKKTHSPRHLIRR